MKVSVCIGSSCHLKGAKQVVQSFRKLIDENGLQQDVEFGASFCMGNCQNGVSVGLNDEICSVTPETAEEFFRTRVMAALKK